MGSEQNIFGFKQLYRLWKFFLYNVFTLDQSEPSYFIRNQQTNLDSHKTLPGSLSTSISQPIMVPQQNFLHLESLESVDMFKKGKYWIEIRFAWAFHGGRKKNYKTIFQNF